MKRLLQLIVGIAFIGVASFAAAATLYVDARNGSDTDPGNCKKTTPCLSIQFAIDFGARGARVIVAPGYYEENLVINEDSVKIYSSSGRDVTEIIGTNAGSAGVTINGKSVVFGSKAKGSGLVFSAR